MIGLVGVVSFGNVLDIAAILTEQPEPLNFHGKPQETDVSNFLSGLC